MQTHSFYLSDYIHIDVLNPYAKIHPCIIYSFVRITEWSWNFSKIWTFYMTLGFKPKIVQKLDRIDKNFFDTNLFRIIWSI